MQKKISLLNFDSFFEPSSLAVPCFPFVPFRKKKKNKAKKALEDISQSTSKGKIDRSEEDHEEETVDTRTPAEIAYDKIKEKRVSVLSLSFRPVWKGSCHFDPCSLAL